MPINPTPLREKPPLIIPVASAERAIELRRELPVLETYVVPAEHIGLLELLAAGALSPLRGFMTQAQWESSASSSALPTGEIAAPVALEVPDDLAGRLRLDERLVLGDAEGVPLAILTVRDVWRRSNVPGTRPTCCVGGEVEVLIRPATHDFPLLRSTPEMLRLEAKQRRWGRLVGLVSDRPLHRAEIAVLANQLEIPNTGLAVFTLRPRRASDSVRFMLPRAHRAALRALYHADVRHILLPDIAASVEASPPNLLAGMVVRNYGCSDWLFLKREGDSGERLAALEKLGLRVLVGDCGPPAYAVDDVDRALERGEELPSWFTFPEVDAELRRAHPARTARGFTIFFTGLSGSGKSTIARMLSGRLSERTARPVSLLDGDVVRRHLSHGLGFSRADREENIRRIAYVAFEITKHRGIAICAPIAPYEASRREARALIEHAGEFVLVFVDAPLDLCERRDRKGLYAKARAGAIGSFTGVSDPYEPPANADVIVKSGETTPELAVDAILEHLERRGYLSPDV